MMLNEVQILESILILLMASQWVNLLGLLLCPHADLLVVLCPGLEPQAPSTRGGPEEYHKVDQKAGSPLI